MAKQSPEHMQHLAGKSASSRRATKIAGLIETAPPLEAHQVEHLCALLTGDGIAQNKQPQDKQAKLDRQVQQIVDAAPVLTDEQRDRLALLLRGVGVTS